MTTLTITGKRQWREGKYEYMECFCNGQHLKDRLEPGKGFVASDIEQRLKNTCKMIKLFGDPYYKIGRLSPEEHDRFVSCPLPEWDE